jgi:hypothetical protein
MLLTDDPLLVTKGREAGDFPVPLCAVPIGGGIAFGHTPEGLAALDDRIAANRIGEIVNLSQSLNSLYWDLRHKGAPKAELDALYGDVCVLAVLSGMEIDSAKRQYPVKSSRVLSAIRAGYGVRNGEVRLPPAFFAHVQRKKHGEVTHYHTPMDLLCEAVIAHNRTLPKPRRTLRSMSDLVGRVHAPGRGGSLSNRIERLVTTATVAKQRIDRIRINWDEKRLSPLYPYYVDRIVRELQHCLAVARGAFAKPYAIHLLAKRIDDPQNAEIAPLLLYMLCEEEEHRFYHLLRMNGAPPGSLFPDPAGEIDVYGKRFTVV